MNQLYFRQLKNYLYRSKFYRILKNNFISICFLFLFIQYLTTKYYKSKGIPSPILTRHHQDLPIRLDLRSYPSCHPKEFHLENLTRQYHQIYSNNNQQPCFLIEHLDGGPWFTYVSQEFGEILTYLKQLGIQSNITYQTLSEHIGFDYKRNLTKYFLNTCNIDGTLPREKQNPIIILLWDVNRPFWYRIHREWYSFLNTTRTHILVFIDDLHYGTEGTYLKRQYLFRNVASEIFSTYAYLFHNYYSNISPKLITWLPHSASMHSSRSINQTAENILFVSGANIQDWYPCRWRAFSLCQTRSDLATCLQHPGYGATMSNDTSYYYGGQRYSVYMKKYVFGLGTCQSVHYAIAKLFELPANGLVLVTTDDLVPILEKLGLNFDEHFLTIDCSSEEKLIEEISRIKKISNNNLLKIRKKSQNIIFERHLTKHRAELLHTRLLSHALLLSSTSNKQRLQWEQWGRNCSDS